MGDSYQVVMMRWERTGTDRRERCRCTLCGDRVDAAVWVLRGGGRRRLTVCHDCLYVLGEAAQGQRRVVSRREDGETLG